MTQPRKASVIGSAAVVAIAGVIGHVTGALHGAEESLPGIRVLVAHSDPWSAAASTFKDYARGDFTERAVARAACTFVNAYLYELPETGTIKAGLWAQLGMDPSSSPAYSPLVTKAADVIYLAERNGGLAANYARLCVLPKNGQ